ncbi:hypothetical protein RND81_11G032800 [Saponaria officinalis]|uniref:Uncharacterized protein n=1 Tax=Saponaria officinalis TaxID=3572 RepID=A0AAW1HHK0_SAPOF
MICCTHVYSICQIPPTLASIEVDLSSSIPKIVFRTESILPITILKFYNWYHIAHPINILRTIIRGKCWINWLQIYKPSLSSYIAIIYIISFLLISTKGKIVKLVEWNLIIGCSTRTFSGILLQKKITVILL